MFGHDSINQSYQLKISIKPRQARKTYHARYTCLRSQNVYNISYRALDHSYLLSFLLEKCCDKEKFKKK